MSTSERAAYFDQWYADMRHSPVKDEVERRHLGLPQHLQSTSLLTWDGLADVTDALRLSPGDLLLDLACGRGGYGLEVAQRTGARLVGVDFSAEAVRQARTQAHGLGREGDFEVGTLEATRIEDSSVDAVMVVDSIQFAEHPARAYAELARVLRPGGRVVLTCWEVVDPDDETQPAGLRAVDLRGGLVAAGFTGVEVVERPDWRLDERAMWEEAVTLDPGDDPALLSFRDEGVRSLRHHDARRRVWATASSPG
ncbi:methyltransferase domain-containing protein [Nocardioides panacis]|uniref:Methyltransferase domain-containing protein n=1 Tax=Nocardioides panacis TaxID=2849501 RepID=A0A975Y157_9ACTN|nr:methyltransferase domain-containing protein [Nocardioides panacis]QWZ09171.1 methyltransferase domain-containing protein [Nocardioides panacis]